MADHEGKCYNVIENVTANSWKVLIPLIESGMVTPRGSFSSKVDFKPTFLKNRHDPTFRLAIKMFCKMGVFYVYPVWMEEKSRAEKKMTKPLYFAMTFNLNGKQENFITVVTQPCFQSLASYSSGTGMKVTRRELIHSMTHQKMGCFGCNPISNSDHIQLSIVHVNEK
jgi:hypothetical protein